MRDYELVYIVRPTASDEELSALAERVQSWIGADGGETQRVHPWGRRRMAFAIGDHREGNYVQLNFRAQPRAIREIERNLKLSEDVIRYLLVRPGV